MQIDVYTLKKKMLQAKQTRQVNKRESGASSQWKGHYAIYWQSSYIQSQGYPSEYFLLFQYFNTVECPSCSFRVL